MLDLPPDEINVSMIQRDCNWLQAIEGEIDTAHFGFLHGGHVDPERRADENEPFYFTITNRAPQYHVADAPWGTQYAGYRAAGPGQHLLALRQLPVSLLDAGAQRRVRQPHACPRLGADRRRPHACSCSSGGSSARSAQALPQPAYKDGTPIGGTGRGATSCCPTPPTGWAAGAWPRTRATTGAWTATAQRSNEIYSGIDGIHLQDQAITESMGPVTDYALRASGPSDQMITRTRRRLLLAARALRDKAERPPGVDDRGVYHGARSGYFVSDDQRLLAGGLCQDAGRGGPSPLTAPRRRAGLTP